jgi:hypothetical protein
MPELNEEQGQAIARARRALTYIASAWPNEGRALVATACAGELVDLLTGPVAVPLVEVINRELMGTPYELTRRKAN